MERPSAEEVAKEAAAVRAAGAAKREAAEEKLRVEFYRPRLADLGITPEQAETVLDRLGAMYKTAVVSGDSLLDLQLQRHRHDAEMKTLLGEDGYQRYRQVEALKPYQSEVTRELLPLAEQKGIVLDAPMQQLLVTLLAKHGVTTWETWDGPYDPLPRPGVGVEASIEHTDRKLSQLQGLDQFLQDAAVAVPKDVFTLVSAYFGDEKSRLGSTRALLMMPTEQRLAIERARAEERLNTLRNAGN